MTLYGIFFFFSSFLRDKSWIDHLKKRYIIRSIMIVKNGEGWFFEYFHRKTDLRFDLPFLGRVISRSIVGDLMFFSTFQIVNIEWDGSENLQGIIIIPRLETVVCHGLFVAKHRKPRNIGRSGCVACDVAAHLWPLCHRFLYLHALISPLSRISVLKKIGKKRFRDFFLGGIFLNVQNYLVHWLILLLLNLFSRI